MRHNLAMHMLSVDAPDIDALALRVHTDACVRTRFRSKEISRSGGLAEALAHYGGPTCLAWGEHDVTADPPTMAAELAAPLRDARTQVVAHAGHWVQYERADAINPLLLEEGLVPPPGAQVLSLYATERVLEQIREGQVLAAPTDSPVIQARIALDLAVRGLQGEKLPQLVSPQIEMLDAGSLDRFDLGRLMPPEGHWMIRQELPD